jgi:hypothetical protein
MAPATDPGGVDMTPGVGVATRAATVKAVGTAVTTIAMAIETYSVVQRVGCIVRVV